MIRFPTSCVRPQRAPAPPVRTAPAKPRVGYCRRPQWDGMGGEDDCGSCDGCRERRSPGYWIDRARAISWVGGELELSGTDPWRARLLAVEGWERR